MPVLQIHPKLSLYYQDYPPAPPYGKPELYNRDPVLLLHGLGATSESWALQIPALTESGFRVIAPDVRGFGKSTHPGGNTSIAEMTADIAHLLVAIQSAPANVVGISMGGALALQLALDYPHLVKRLVLVNAFAGLRPKNPGIWLYFILRFIVAQIIGVRAQAKIVAKRIFPHPDQEPYRQMLVEQISQADPHGYRTAMRALGRFNVVSRLGEINHPTLIITGEKDTTVPPDAQSILAKSIPGARQVVIPNAGHAVIAEQPQAFNSILLAFLCQGT